MFNTFWDKSITVYTPYNFDNELNWYHYMINNVFVTCNKNKNFNDNDYSSYNNTIIRINKSNYIDYNVWLKLTDENKNKCFSICLESIIVLDKVEDTIPKNDSGSFLFDKYSCSKPKNIKNNLFHYLPHIFIIGD